MVTFWTMKPVASVHNHVLFCDFWKELGFSACKYVVLGNARRSFGRDRSPSCLPRTAASEMRPYQSEPVDRLSKWLKNV